MAVSPIEDRAMTYEEPPEKKSVPGKDSSGGCIMLVLVVLFCAGLCYGYFEMGNTVWHAYLLSSNGVPARVQVTRSTTVWASEGARPPRSVQRYRYDMKFDGHVGTVIR